MKNPVFWDMTPCGLVGLETLRSHDAEANYLLLVLFSLLTSSSNVIINGIFVTKPEF